MILRGLADAVLVTDRSGRLVFLNAAAERLTGYPLAQAFGRPIGEIAHIVTGDKRKPVPISLHRALQEPADDRGAGHVLFLGRNGGERYVDSSVSVRRDEGGRPAGLILVFRDITDREAAARTLLSHQKVEIVGTMARHFAADFGALVNAVVESGETLVQALIPKTKAHADAVRIVEAGRKARELTQFLANVARSSEPTAPAAGPVYLAQVLQDTAKLLEGRMKEADVRFEAIRLAQMPAVKAATGQLMDMLMCVFTNAIDAMPRGGVLSVRAWTRYFARPERRANPSAKPGRYVILRVSDTGVGMDRETVGRIFEPFFTTKGAGLTRGLSLTVVYNTLQQWGGWITVRSEPGRGAAFLLHLPYVAPAPEEPRRPDRAVPRILVLDDRRKDLALVRGILENAGYRVSAARERPHARGSAPCTGRERDPVDGLVAAVPMPPAAGRALYESVLRSCPNAAVVLTSGFSRDFVRTSLGRSGWGFVQKPIDGEALLSTLQRALEQRRLDQESANAGTPADSPGRTREHEEEPK